MGASKRICPNCGRKMKQQFIGLFQDLHKKSENSEISTKSVDLRGFISAIHLMDKGLPAVKALNMGIANKAFDDFEQELVVDVIRLRISEKLERDEIFSN